MSCINCLRKCALAVENWNDERERGSGRECTKVEGIHLKIHHLGCVDGKGCDVASILAVASPDDDLGGPLDDSEPARVAIRPPGLDFVEEPLERLAVGRLLLQGGLLASQGHDKLGLAQLGLDLRDRQLASKSNDITQAVLDVLLDVSDGDSEAAVAADEDVLRVVGPLELVVSFRVEAGNMLVRNAMDPVAWLAVLGLDLAEEEGEGGLRVVGLPGNRDTKANVEGMVEAKCGTGAVLDCHQRPAGQLLVKNVVYYSPMYWYICWLDASHRCPVVNKDCRLSPSTSLSSSWFLSFAYIALVVLSPSLEANDP